jgi:hypothetical protein
MVELRDINNITFDGHSGSFLRLFDQNVQVSIVL